MFFTIFFLYIKMTNLLSKTQRKTKKSERYQNLSEEGKDKRQKMPEKDTKI